MKAPLLAAHIAPFFLNAAQPLRLPPTSPTEDPFRAWPASWAARFQQESAPPLPTEKMRASLWDKYREKHLCTLDIPPSPLNRSIYAKALQIEGRSIAVGLSGVLIDCAELSRTSHSITQLVRLKPGVPAMLHGLKRANALTLYTHEPAIRIARIFERFQILQDIFMDATWSGEPVESDEELLSYGHVICFENQLSVITALLKKSMEGKTLFGWESAILRTLQRNTDDMLHLAYLKSRHIAMALGECDFDTVVTSHHAWKTMDEEDGAPMLLVPTQKNVPSNVSILHLVDALQESTSQRVDRILAGTQRIDQRMSVQEIVQLPMNYPAPEVGEFNAAMMKYSSR